MYNKTQVEQINRIGIPKKVVEFNINRTPDCGK